MVSTHRTLLYFTQSGHFCVTHKQADGWTDRVITLPTPCAQAHRVTSGEWTVLYSKDCEGVSLTTQQQQT